MDFFGGDIKAFKEAINQTMRHADQHKSEDTEHLQTLHACLCHSDGAGRQRGGGTTEPLPMMRQLSQCLPLSAAAASKMLSRFTGNSGRSQSTDSQTAVAGGGGGE